jgi:hypothetical protein
MVAVAEAAVRHREQETPVLARRPPLPGMVERLLPVAVVVAPVATVRQAPLQLPAQYPEAAVAVTTPPPAALVG